jgi:hypothetical protein
MRPTSNLRSLRRGWLDARAEKLNPIAARALCRIHGEVSRANGRLCVDALRSDDRDAEAGGKVQRSGPRIDDDSIEGQPQPHPQFLRIEGLGDIVVGSTGFAR